jgi:hypothetical protein
MAGSRIWHATRVDELVSHRLYYKRSFSVGSKGREDKEKQES